MTGYRGWLLRPGTRTIVDFSGVDDTSGHRRSKRARPGESLPRGTHVSPDLSATGQPT